MGHGNESPIPPAFRHANRWHACALSCHPLRQAVLKWRYPKKMVPSLIGTRQRCSRTCRPTLTWSDTNTRQWGARQSRAFSFPITGASQRDYIHFPVPPTSIRARPYVIMKAGPALSWPSKIPTPISNNSNPITQFVFNADFRNEPPNAGVTRAQRAMWDDFSLVPRLFEPGAGPPSASNSNPIISFAFNKVRDERS